ncbi:hypothetical protein HPB47_007259, partial [Ixodes persulcatus]
YLDGVGALETLDVLGDATRLDLSTTGVDGLREIVRDIVQEELRKLLPTDNQPAALSIAEVVREEVQRAFQPEAPASVAAPEEPTLTYAAVARRPAPASRQYWTPPRRDPPAPQTFQRRDGQPQLVRTEQPANRKTDVWRTADRRPLCYHCGIKRPTSGPGTQCSGPRHFPCLDMWLQHRPERIWAIDDKEGEHQELIDLLDPVELQTEAEEKRVMRVIEDKIMFLPNWKTQGPDGTDERLYVGTTYLIEKTKRARSGKELHFLTFLPNIFKLLRKVLTSLETDLCEVNEVISAYQMGTRRGCQGAKQQALLNKLLNQKRNNDLFTPWIDIRKAHDSAQHDYLVAKPTKVGMPENFKFVKRTLASQCTSLDCRQSEIDLVRSFGRRVDTLAHTPWIEHHPRSGMALVSLLQRPGGRNGLDLRLTGSLVPVVLLMMGSEVVVPLHRRWPALLRSNRAHLLFHQHQKTLKA